MPDIPAYATEWARGAVDALTAAWLTPAVSGTSDRTALVNLSKDRVVTELLAPTPSPEAAGLRLSALLFDFSTTVALLASMGARNGNVSPVSYFANLRQIQTGLSQLTPLEMALLAEKFGGG